MTKSKKIVLFVLIATLVLSFGLLSFTAAKYIREVGNSGSHMGDTGDIPLNMLDKIEVTNQEELKNALQNKYPYVKLSDKVKDPLIITQDIMQVSSSLVLDLNGKRLERVGSAAMVNVEEGITLTIIDSNKNATGGLYNPVGTVLQVTGGTLNVRGGKFESGPRTWEYASYTKTSTVHNRLENNVLSEVQYFDATTGDAGIKLTMPIISPKITTDETSGEVIGVDGNIYFDVAYNGIPADTYCYYVSSDNFSSNTTTGFDDSAADFRYTYYVQPKTYIYAEDQTNTEGLVQITVYGFEKDIQKAMGWGNSTETITAASGVNSADAPWYAAVRMDGGTLNVDCQDPTKVDSLGKNTYVNTENYLTLGMGIDNEGNQLTGEAYTLNVEAYKYFGKGSFISYFGVETASCVQFTSGEMNVATDGVFATVNPKTIRNIYKDDPDKEEKEKNALASEGRGICIHNNGNSTNTDYGILTVNKGNFLTYNMSIVRLMEGTCIVNDSKCYRVQDTSFYKHKENGDVIGYTSGTGTVYSAGGDVKIFDTEVWIKSKKTITDEAATEITDFEGAYGIYAAKGNISATDTTIYADGDCCRGIYSNPLQENNDQSGAKGPSGEGGHVDLKNIKVFVSGTRTFGVYSRGGTITIDADEPVLDEVHDVLAYNSRFFMTGNRTMCVYATNDATLREAKAIEMSNTRIRVNVSLDENYKPIYTSIENRPGDFNVAVNSVNANLLFDNVSVESSAYGVTALNGTLDIFNCDINAMNASATVVKGGTINVQGKTSVNCYIKQEYVDNVPNLWERYLGTDTRNYFKTHSGIDIQGGLLNIVKTNEKSTTDKFIYTFDTDVVTPQTKDRIIIDENGNLPYVVNGKNADGTEIKSPVFGTNGQMNAASAMLPAAMCAVRVSGGIKGLDALNITCDCEITAKVGGGVLVRDGNVKLGDEGQQFITIETQGGDFYSDKYQFMGKPYWDYRDTKTGGNALFVSGGNVTSKATNLTLKSALGNGLFVTGASILPDADFKYKGEIKLDNPPIVEIDAGTFKGDATNAYLYNNWQGDKWWNFVFTGPSSFYGVKVVCGGDVTINGGSFSGYGAVCTMGAITENPVPAHLTINGDYNNMLDRITMEGKRDVACFYNASYVTINSNDNPDAKIIASDKYDYANAEDFGVAIPNGANTAIVIEALGHGSGTEVKINGGYYRAIAGDPTGAKAIWCSNNNATLTINGGYFIGNKNKDNGNNGGAIQLYQYTQLAALNLNGGYFFNYDGGDVLTGTIPSDMLHLGENNEKTFYQLTVDENGYFTKKDNDAVGTYSNYAVYVADKKPTEEQPEQPQQ